MPINVDMGDGRIVEFPDEQTANEYFASQKAQTSGPSIAGDVGKAVPRGLLVGGSELLDIPGDVWRGVSNIAERGISALGAPDMGQRVSESLRRGLPVGNMDIPELTAQVTGGFTEQEPETTAGQYAQTAAEFVPGAVGGGPKAVGQMALAGLSSEAFGQMTEGTAIEPFARVVGAIAPSAIGGIKGAIGKTLNRGSTYPSVEALRAAKNDAYRAADNAGVTFSKEEVGGMVSQVDDIIRNATDYVPEVDRQTFASVQAFMKQSGRELTLGQLDKLRQGLWKRYNAAPNETVIMDLIGVVDDAIARSGPADDIMQAARLANTKFRKAELLDDAFTKAADQAASTGSGGNVLNKYRQAVTNIINNPKKAKFFSEQEVEVMRRFVQGNFSENTLRLMGKLSPSGNGLMAALNLGAVAVDPTMLFITAGASGAKVASDAMVKSAADDLQKMLATGVPASERKAFGEEIMRLIPGLLAQQE